MSAIDESSAAEVTSLEENDQTTFSFEFDPDLDSPLDNISVKGILFVLYSLVFLACFFGKCL